MGRQDGPRIGAGQTGSYGRAFALALQVLGAGTCPKSYRAARRSRTKRRAGRPYQLADVVKTPLCRFSFLSGLLAGGTLQGGRPGLLTSDKVNFIGSPVGLLVTCWLLAFLSGDLSGDCPKRRFSSHLGVLAIWLNWFLFWATGAGRARRRGRGRGQRQGPGYSSGQKRANGWPISTRGDVGRQRATAKRAMYRGVSGLN